MAKHFASDTYTKASKKHAVTPAVRSQVQVGYSQNRASIEGNYVGRDARRARPRRKKTLSGALLVIGITLLLIAGGLFIFAQIQYGAQNKINEKLAEYVEVSDQAAGAPEVDWEGLKAINDDVVGWIEIPGTVVNYPVYQGSDNDEYLHLTAEGEYSIGGQIFMDYENAAPGLIDRQTIIYGHHLYNGTMFTAIDDMCDQSAFDAVDTIWYVTESATYELEPLFIYKSAATNGEARQSVFASDEDFHAYLEDLLAQASAKSDGASSAVSRVTKVLTLVTCDYNNDFGQGNGRSLLVCALKSEVGSAE